MIYNHHLYRKLGTVAGVFLPLILICERRILGCWLGPPPVKVARFGGAHLNTLWASQSVRSPRPVGPCDTQTYTF